MPASHVANNSNSATEQQQQHFGPDLILSKSLLDGFQLNDRHLSSRDEDLVVKYLTLLIKDIANGVPIFRSVVLNVIKHALPMNSKPVQRVLHVFLEMMPKRDPSTGQFVSEFIMICELISQQIKGPNEFLAGNALRFMGNIKEETLITPLLPSILSVMNHEHMYVRTNALNCMLQITQTFPNLFTEDLEKRIYDVLDNDENVECQVMAFKLIATHEPSKAFGFIFTIAGHSQNLHPHINYTMLRFIDHQLKQQKSDEELTMLLNNDHLQLFVETLLSNSSNEIVLEAATLILNYSYGKEITCAAYLAIIGVMLQESQSQVKIGLLDLLGGYKKSKMFKQLLEDSACKILENFLLSDPESKCAALRFIADLIDSKNSKPIVSTLFRYMQKQNFSKLTDHDIYQSNSSDSFVTAINLSLETLGICCKQFPFHCASTVFEFMPKVLDLYANEHFTNALMTSLNVLLGQDELCLDGLSKLIEISQTCIDMPLSSLFWLFTANINSLDSASIFYERALLNDSSISEFMSHIDELLPLFICLVKVMTIFERNGHKKNACVILKTLARVYSCASLPLKSESGNVKNDAQNNSLLVMNMFWTAIKNHDMGLLDEIIAKNIKNYSNSSGELVISISTPNVKAITDPLELSLFADSINRQSCSNQLQCTSTTPDFNSLTESYNLDKVVQLTSINDDVYAEAFLLGGKYDVIIDMMLVNRLSKTIYNLTFGVVRSEGMTTETLPQINDLKAGSVKTVKLRIRLSSPTSNFAALSLMYHVGSTASEKQVINMDNIYIASLDHIIPKSCDRLFFLSKWPELEWEKLIEPLYVQIKSLPPFTKYIENEAKIRLVEDENTSTINLNSNLIVSLNFCATTLLGELMLINLTIEGENYGFELNFKIRASDKESASKLNKILVKTVQSHDIFE